MKMKVGICEYKVYIEHLKEFSQTIKNIVGIEGDKMWHIGWDIPTKIGPKTCEIISFIRIGEQVLGE